MAIKWMGRYRDFVSAVVKHSNQYNRVANVDSVSFEDKTFSSIAWQELLVMMCIQIVLKSLYEVLILPVTIRVVNAIKRIDGSDVYDEGISYKVWKISEI